MQFRAAAESDTGFCKGIGDLRGLTRTWGSLTRCSTSCERRSSLTTPTSTPRRVLAITFSRPAADDRGDRESSGRDIRGESGFHRGSHPRASIMAAQGKPDADLSPGSQQGHRPRSTTDGVVYQPRTDVHDPRKYPRGRGRSQRGSRAEPEINSRACRNTAAS